MTSSLTITRHPYEEPYHVNLIVCAATDGVVAEQEIYTNATDLQEFAQAMIGFPKQANDVFKWELGSEAPEENFAFYFCLEVRKIRARGRCAVHIRFNNNKDDPHRRVAEFSFGAVPSDLDRLGRLMAVFAQLDTPVLEWGVEDDVLA